MKDVSPALIRFLGFLGFMTFGLVAIEFGNKVFNIGLNLSNPLYLFRWGVKEIMLFGASLVFAFIGMFIGWGIGLNIKIRNPKVESIINTLWHYGANGSIIWTLFSIGILSLAIGKEGVKEFLFTFGYTSFLLVMIGIGLTGSWLISWIASFIGRMYNNEMGYLLSYSFLIIVGICMGIAQSVVFDIPLLFGVGIGFFFPFVLVLISTYTQKRDERIKKMMSEES
jgi:hypothetical protein